MNVIVKPNSLKRDKKSEDTLLQDKEVKVKQGFDHRENMHPLKTIGNIKSREVGKGSKEGVKRRKIVHDDLGRDGRNYLISKRLHADEMEGSETEEEVETPKRRLEEKTRNDASKPIKKLRVNQEEKKKVKSLDFDDITFSEEESIGDLDADKENIEYYERLFLGEADFSYARAVVNKKKAKHPNLVKSIIATAYESKERLERLYPDTFQSNKQYLEEKKVTLMYEVDATDLHEDKRLKNRAVERIHFNFPHDKSKFQDRTLPELIKKFFESAGKIQKERDRVYVALPKPKDISKRQFYEGFVYGIYDAAREANYNLIAKRKFGSERYPGYEHKITGINSGASVAEEAREYIFEKLAEDVDENAFNEPVKKFVYGEECNALPEIETGSESSEYAI